jgi:signal transduction histidine kinase
VTLASVRVRLALAGIVMVFVVTAGAWAGLSMLIDRHVERWAVTELRSQVDLILSNIRIDANGRIVLLREPSEPRFFEPFSGRYWQVSHGEDRLRSPSLWGNDIDVSNVAPEVFGDLVVEQVRGPIFEPILVAHRSLALPGSAVDDQIIVSVAWQRATLMSLRQDFLTDLFPYAAAFALLLLFAFAVQFAVGLSPLSRIRARVLALAKGDAKRIGTDLPLEVRPLALEIDRLLDERDTQILKAKKRAAELAHTFKTPLQALMGEAHRLRKAGHRVAADGVEDIVATMQTHVERELHAVRTIAMAERRADPAQISEDLIGVLRRIPAYAELVWTVTRHSTTQAAADPAALTEALGAILENAARHAVSKVEVGIANDPDGRLRITVKDDGGGLRGAGVNEPDEESHGDGMGLSIAADLARASGGFLQLKSTTPGLEASIVLDAKAA